MLTPMKVKCLIVEDEPIAQQVLISYIEKSDFLEVVARMSNAIDALNYLQNHQVDLLFLDIKMPQMSGMELLKALQVKPKVIITSAFRYYAIDAFELDVVDYLLKPYPFDRFLKAVSKVMTSASIPSINTEKKERQFIFVKGNKQLHKIYTEDILYLESQRDYLKFRMLEHPDVITRQTIAYYEEFLPAHLFVRVHRSFIVAIDKITTVEATRVLIGGAAIPVGRIYKQSVQERLKSVSV